MNTLRQLSRLLSGLVLLFAISQKAHSQCTNPSIPLPDMSTPVDGNAANAYCVTLMFNPAMTGYPTGLSFLLYHTYQGDLDVFINACGNTLSIMQRPGAVGNCAGGSPFGNGNNIGTMGSPALITFSNTGPDPENGIPLNGGSFGITADDACGVGTPGINTFNALWAACPPGIITAEICIGDHALGDSGVAQDISLTFPSPIICGCTDPTAANYNPAANVDDGKCQCLLAVSASATQPTCASATGSISVSPSGAGYTYVWSPGSVSGANPTNLAPGTYSVTVTETATGCVGIASVTLNPSMPLMATATATQPTCALNNGSISVTPSGAGYTYMWSPASVSGSNPTNLAPGTYSVTVTHTASGCTATASVTLNPSVELMATATPTQPTCGMTNGSISVSPAGAGYTYVWNPASVSGSNPTNLGPGTYSVTVTQTASGCTDVVSVTLNPSATLMISATPTQPTCGMTNGSISVSPAGAGYTYAWNPASASGSNPTNLGPGTYSVTVTETASGCTASTSVTLNPSTSITVTATPTQPTCALNNGSISVSPSGGGYTYAWSPASVFGPNPSNLAPGTYSVTVTETATGCTGNTTVTLNPSSPVMINVSVTQPTCGQNNGFISVTPTGAGYTYAWNPATISGPAATNLPPGTYSVTITQIDGGCTDDATVTLNPSPPPVANITANPAAICTGESTQLTATGGGTYSWSTGQTGAMITVSPTSTTTYSVTTTNNGCAAVGNITVTVNTVTATASANPSASCSGDPVQLTATGGGTYLWSTGQTGAMITVNPTATTTYSVTVTNNGCTDVAMVTVTINTVTATASANPGTSCSGDPVQLTATGGGTYLWSTGQTGAMITVNPTATTTYSVTVTNNGCTDVAMVTVTVPVVTATAMANPTTVCSGDPVQLTATGGGTYLWSTGQTGAMITVTPTATTTYSVTVTNSGCTDVAMVTVTVNVVNASAIANPNPICPGQSAVLTAMGGGTYLWSTGQTGANITVSPSATTAYMVTVTNGGCTGQATINVVINTVNANITADMNPICAGQTSILTATGGGTYLWSTGQTGASISVNPTATTTYSVTVTNNGCTDVANLTVTVNSVTATATAMPATVCNGASSTLTATGGGTYLWSTGQTGANISVSPTTTTNYTVTVTNNGCTDVASVTVMVTTVTATATASPAMICGGGTSTLTATGGGTYLWSTGQIGASITVAPSATTTYSVTVTNNGCTDVATVTVTVGTVTASASANPSTICAGTPATLMATGGGTYLWSTGQTGANITVALGSTTTFTVTVTNNGCTDVASVTVTVNSTIAQATASPSSICPGLSTTLTATGGGTYVWSDGQTGSPITVMPSATTTYTVTVTNSGCSNVATVTVMVSDVLTPSVTASPMTVCPGQSSVLTASGGDFYMWSTGQSGASITVNPTSTTTYTVTATNNGCTGTADITVTVDPGLVATAMASPMTVCAGQATTLSATGGGNYVWSDGQSGSPITVMPSATTTYTVTVTNNGCTGTADVTVNVNPLPTATAMADPAAICTGENTMLTATGGGTYLWSDGQIGASVTVMPSATTTYTVTVTNNGCTNTANVTVTVNPPPMPTATASPTTLCAGESATLTATGGGTYAWSGGQSGSPITVTPSATTTYTVTVTNNGCSAMTNVTVTVNPLPMPTATASPATLCEGQSATLTATGGGTYAWSTGQSGSPITVTPSATTTYTVTVTNNGCTATADVAVTVNPLPMPTATANPAAICIGQSTTLTATGGGTYAWSDGQSGSSITVMPSATTTYTVTVTNNGCTGTADVTVTVNETTASAAAVPATICPGLTSTLTATGGGTYAWSNGQSGATINVMPNATTTYTVTVTNNGCTDIATVTVNVENNLSATAAASPATICAGEATTLTATGGGTYAWSDGQSGSIISVQPSFTTIYTVTVTNNGCTGTADVMVTVNPLPTAFASANPAALCEGSSTTLSATGGSTYLWNTGQSGSNIVVVPTATTTYTVTVTNNGCTETADVTVTVNPLPIATATASPDFICAGESTTLTATGGGTYAWSTGQTGASIVVSPTTTSIYSVTVTVNGCSAVTDVTVDVNPNTIPTATASPATLCQGGTSVLTATGGGTYAWSTGQTGASISVTPSATTTYTVTVTNNGCTATADVMVTVNPLPAPNISANPATICAGASTTLTASGGNTYLWSTGQSGASITVVPNATTTYSVTATSNGCTGTADATVVVNTTTATATASLSMICPGVSTTLTATGGGTYLWNTGDTNAQIIVSPAATTTYTVTVTNNGCTDVAMITVTVGNVLTPSVTASPTTVCPGQPSVLTASGGGTYLWNTGETGASITVMPLATTTYSVTVTSNNCSGTADITVTVDAALSATATASPDTLCAGASATLTATGGGNYVWSDGQTGASVTVSPLATTTYTVTVTNNGCTGTANVAVVVNPLPVPIATANPAAICAGESSALTATGGDTYLWSDGQSGAAISVMPSATTTYTVTVTDDGCEATTEVTVTVNPLPSPSATASSDTICTGQSTILTAAGGNSYSWSDGQSGASISVMPSATTTYTVTVTDNGCEATAETTVLVNPLPTVMAMANDATLCAGQSTTLTASGGDTYLWSDGQSGASITITPSATTTYTTTVTDSNGCQATATATVTVNPLPIASAIGDTICAGESATLTASGGDTYLWNTGQTGSTISVSPTTTTTYTVIATTNACSDTTSAIVLVNQTIATASASTTSVCPGLPVDLSATGGGTYLWSTGQSGSPITVTPTANTTYSVTVTNQGCTATSSVTVMLGNSLMPTVSASPDTICIGSSSILTATGGGTYLWSTGQSGASITVSPSMTTTYSVTVSNNGCEGTGQVTVVVNPIPVANVVAMPSIICAGDVATLTASGGNTYLWSTGDTGASISVSPSGTTTYNVTVTTSGCSASASTTLLVNPLPTAMAQPDTICVGESAVLSATGGDIYQWSTGQSGASITVTPPVTTTYSVTVTDEGCTAVVPVTVTVNPLPVPVAIASPPVICAGESSTLSVSGGTSFVWSTGQSGSSITVSPIASANYSVTATENGCVGTTQIMVSVSTPPFAVVTPNADICNGPGGPSVLNFNTLVTGGDQNGSWADVQNSGATGSFPQLDFTGVVPGNYLFRYTTQSAVAPCVNISYDVIIQVVFCNCPSVATLSGGPLCNASGSLDLSALQETTEAGAWSIVSTPVGSNPAIISNNIFSATNADAGLYEIRFTLLEAPPTGCPAFSTQFIQVDDSNFAGTPEEALHLCFGANDVVNLAALLQGEDPGGQWTEVSIVPSTNGAFQASTGSFSVLGQQAFTYRFRYLVGSGGACPSSEATVSVIIEPLPVAQAGTDETLDCVITETTLDGSGSSTGSNIVYLWTSVDGTILSGSNTLSPTVNAAGTYLLTVTNQLYSCSAGDEAVVIAENTPPQSAAIVAQAPLCHNQSNGSISITSVTGGSAPYLYSINGQAFVANPLFAGLSAGTYSLEIEDANGCRWETSITLDNPPALSINAGPDVSIFYGDSTLLNATISPVDLTDYTISWTPTADLACDACVQTLAGPDSSVVYRAVLTDSNGCQATDNVRVNVRIRRDVYIPNGFSPNGDDINDIFMVYAGDGVERILQLEIFTRWGESVFYVADFPPNDPRYGWDGFFRNQPAVLDVYAFFAIVLYKDGEQKIFKGDVTLMR